MEDVDRVGIPGRGAVLWPAAGLPYSHKGVGVRSTRIMGEMHARES